MRRWLDAIPQRLRTPLGVGAGLLLALLLALAIPASRRGGGGTPAAVLFEALVLGLVQSLSAVGIVLVYRTTRVVNFAQTAIGAGGAVLCFDLLQLTGVPFLLALFCGLLVSALLGLAFDIVFGRRFFNAPRLVLTVLTIVAAGLLGRSMSSFLDRLPFFPSPDQRTLDQVTGRVAMRSILPFSGHHFTVGSVPLQFGFPEVLAIVVCASVLLGLGIFLRFSRAGIAVRAMAENTERAALLGISVGLLSTLVWTASGALSGLSVTLTGFLGTPASAFGVAAPQLLLPALAAAVIGRMRNLPVTVAASVGIAVVTTTLSFQRPEWAPFVDGLLFVVVVAGLLLQRERRQRSEKGVTASWKATEELRAIPKELLGIGAVRLTRRLLIAAAVVFVVVWPFVASTDETVLGQVIALNAIVGLSLVILTGWAGQVSLGQFGLVAIGALVAGSLSTRLGFPFWIAVPLATVLTAAVATAIGVPGLRIPGLFLAVATFAFAVAVRAVLFTDSFSWLQPNGRIHRPSLLMIDFEDEKSMYFLCAVALIVACVAVVNLRRSRFGRVLIAVRENDANAAAAGIDPTRLKLMAFAVAGALAGFSGALLAFQGRGVTGSSFDPQASIDIFVQVVLGGVSTVAGALLGSGFWNITHQLLGQFPDLQLALGPAAALVLLYISPGGIVAMVTRVRDAALRIVAMRNQIIVPSLFADIDPAALEARLIPMAPPDERQGLDDIAARYRLRTRLFDTSRARMKSQVEVTRA